MRRKINFGVAKLPVFESREPDRALELSKSYHRRVLGDPIHEEPELMDEYIRDKIHDRVLVTTNRNLEELRARLYIATRVHHAGQTQQRLALEG
jgi:hypothetical protein